VAATTSAGRTTVLSGMVFRHPVVSLRVEPVELGQRLLLIKPADLAFRAQQQAHCRERHAAWIPF